MSSYHGAGPVNHPRYAPPSSFRYFPLLPAELRLLIWSFAVPDPRIIKYSSRITTWHDWSARQYPTNYKLEYHYHGILGACWDSRAEAFKHYTPAFSVEFGHPIFFDFSRDLLEFGDYESFEAFSFKHTPFSGSQMQGDLLRTVGITFDDSMDALDFERLCSNFGKLDKLLICETEREATVYEPVLEIRSQEIEFAWPHVLAQIRHNINRRGGKDIGYRPPLVCKASEQQWELMLMGVKLGLGEEMEWEMSENTILKS